MSRALRLVAEAAQLFQTGFRDIGTPDGKVQIEESDAPRKAFEPMFQAIAKVLSGDLLVARRAWLPKEKRIRLGKRVCQVTKSS